MDPRSRPRRRAIEVYPHPATVALFRLGRTLKYKNKPGPRRSTRCAPSCCALIGLLEGLATRRPAAAPRRAPAAGRELVAAVERRHPQERAAGGRGPGRRRRLRLRRAVRRARSPELTTTYGDLETGYIVTPDPARRATGRPAPRGDRSRPSRGRGRRPGARAVQAVRRAAARAARGRATSSSRWSPRCSTTPASTTSASPAAPRRVASFAAKAARTRRRRAALHRPAARDHRPDRRPRDHLRAQRRRRGRRPARRPGRVLDDRDMGQETASEGRFGYASRHLLVGARRRRGRPRVRAAARPERAGAGAHGAAARVGRVRARHPLQGHHPRGARARPRPPVHPRGRAARAGRPRVLRRSATGCRPRSPASRPSLDDDDPRISAPELAAFLAGQYADAGWSRTDHYAWISGLLLELGITSLDELAGAAALGRRARRSTPGWATATRRAPSAGSTTRCSRSSASATSPARQRPPRGAAAHPAGEAVRAGWPGRGVGPLTGRDRRAGRAPPPEARGPGSQAARPTPPTPRRCCRAATPPTRPPAPARRHGPAVR